MDFDRLDLKMRDWSPGAILGWAWDRFAPDLAMSSSFQTQSVVLLHLVSQVVPEMRIFFLDTGFHFPETLRFRDQLAREWNLNVVDLRAKPEPKPVQEGRRLSLPLYQADPDRCCARNKLEPLREAMLGLNAWISGIRRDQTQARTDIRTVEPFGSLIRIHPMANWTTRRIWQYIHEHDLPVHPLLEQGYSSVGCQPCTEPVLEGGDERSGRWSGLKKVECGLHTELRSNATSAEARPDESEG